METQSISPVGDLPEWAPKAYYTLRGAFTQSGFDVFVLKNNIPRSPDGRGFYNVWDVIRCMRRETSELSAGSTDSGDSVDKELKKERIRKLQIENATKSGEVIDRLTVKERMASLYNGVKDTIRHAIKMCAPKMVSLPNAIIAEQMMTAEWNRAIEYLGTVTDVKEWEDEEVRLKPSGIELPKDSTESVSDGNSEEDKV